MGDIMLKRLPVLLLSLIILFNTQICAGAVSVSAQSAVLIEASTGKILYENNAYEKLPMASTTKIMTAVTVLENAVLTDTVTVSANAAATEGSSMYLESGEKITVLELLYGLMLSSGNDAANALAEHVSGNGADFPLLMNQIAERIGMKSSNFVTPSGLDESEHYSTAYDMAILTAYALKNDVFRKIVSTRSKTVGEGEDTHYLVNHNKLLGRYKYCIGVKTGYTMKSGRCLVSAAEKDGVRLIAVTLNDRNDWNDHIEMLDYGFSCCEYAKFSDKAETFTLPVAGNGNTTVTEFKPFGKMLFGSEVCSVTRVIEMPRFLYPPIYRGTVVGYSNYYINGELAESIEILADSDVGKVEEKSVFGKLAKWFADILLTERNKRYG